MLLSLGAGMKNTSQLQVVEVMLSVIRRLAPIVLEIRKHDRDLADQIRRAATSAAGNLAEGDGSIGGTKRARYVTALGSARETRTHLASAVSWGYVAESVVDEIDVDLDRVCAMAYRLVHLRR
jgi:four helix bundle protein